MYTVMAFAEKTLMVPQTVKTNLQVLNQFVERGGCAEGCL